MNDVRCAVCSCAIHGHSRSCPVCQVPYHLDCWSYAGGCAIFGCKGAAQAAKHHGPIASVAPREPALIRLGDLMFRNAVVMSAAILVVLPFLSLPLALVWWIASRIWPGAETTEEEGPCEPYIRLRVIMSLVLLAVAWPVWFLAVSGQFLAWASIRTVAPRSA